VEVGFTKQILNIF